MPKSKLEFAIDRLDVLISTLPTRTSAWTAPDKNALRTLAETVVTEYNRSKRA